MIDERLSNVVKYLTLRLSELKPTDLLSLSGVYTLSQRCREYQDYGAYHEMSKLLAMLSDDYLAPNKEYCLEYGVKYGLNFSRIASKYVNGVLSDIDKLSVQTIENDCGIKLVWHPRTQEFSLVTDFPQRFVEWTDLSRQWRVLR
jgi:hypothetical protein